MKRAIICFAVVAMAICIGEKTFSAKEPYSDVLLMNVEALATPEEFITPAFCVGGGSVCCPYTGVKVEYVLELSNIEYDK